MSTEDDRDDDLSDDDLSDLVEGDDSVPTTARDEDEHAADDLLEVDQTELEELGLVLDDPHQPEEE